MKIKVLGSIEADNGTAIALGGPTQRRILAMLAMEAGDIVSVDRLVDATWPDGESTDQAERNVRTYIHRLRAAFGDEIADRIETAPPGYRLNLRDEELDANRFDELASTAARLADTGDAVAALDRIDEADALWRGRPFGEFADEAWAQAEGERLTELHVGIRETRAEMLLEAGRAAAAVSVAEKLAAAFPLRERPRALLIQALYQSGRQPEALRAFQDYRRLVVEEIGVDPSDDLVELDRAVAAGDPELRGAGAAPRLVGAYEMHERIGEGAFAVVHRATQPALGRDVAIKVVRAELANRPEFIRRFEAEAQMVARIEHPSIVPLYDYWREPDRAYLVMRWMTGGSLETRLDGGAMEVPAVIGLVTEIGAALNAAHSAGVVHRDVKPENILFDDDGRAYLGDFGIALETADLARPEAALSEGSPVFASPEQLRREPVGPAADVHALGIVAFTSLVGRTPFADTRDPVGQLQRQLGEAIPSAVELRPELPAGIDAVLAIATAKKAADRYPSVLAFVTAFEAAAGGAEVADASRAVQTRPFANPYKGLRAFDETDSGDFYGRERLVDELVAKLAEPDSTVVAVVGPSGSGKSSVVRAGLVPALRAGRVAGSADWFTTSFTPGAHPFEALETALLRVAVNPPASLLDQLREHPRGIVRGVRRVLPADDAVLLLVIDQFEELFTSQVDSSVTEAFIEALTVAATEPGTPLRVVLTLRADFYDRPLRHTAFAPLLKRSTVVVTPAAPDELERAVVGPAASVGVEFEPGLVAQIVAEVASQPGALPLLQYALTELFETNVSGLLLLERYRELGGLTGALARRADELYEAASAGEQASVRALFGRLVTLGEGNEDTRRRVRLSELATGPSTENIIDRYGAARLLTFDRDALTREPTVEVAHEALIREWPRLGVWLDDDRQGLLLHRHLTSSAAAWANRGRDDGELYRGVRLGAIEAWAEASGSALNPIEAEFLESSLGLRDVEDRAERNRVRRLRRLLVVTGVVAVVALIAGALALRQQQRADDQAALAEQNADLANSNAAEAATNAELANTNAVEAAASAGLAELRAEEAEAAREAGDLERMGALGLAIEEESPHVAALLAVEAHRAAPSVDTLTSLHRALTAVPGFRGTFGGRAYLAVELLDDGVTLAAVGTDSIDVWDLDGRELLRTIAHDNPVATALLTASPDGRLAAIRGELDETFLYDLTTGDSLGVLAHPTTVSDLSLSRDGSGLAVGLAGGQVELWDLATMELDKTLQTGEDDVFFARWSPVEDRLAVVTLRSEVQYWDPATEQVLWIDEAPPAVIVNENTPFGFTFAPAGDRLAFVSGSLGSELRVFNTADGSPAVPAFGLGSVRGFSLDAMFWIDPEASILGVPSHGNVTSFDLHTGRANALLVPRFIDQATDVVFVPALDQFVVATAGGLEVWSADGSGPLERVAPLSSQQLAANAAGGAILPSLAADGSELLVSVFSTTAIPPTTSFDLTSQRLEPEIFDSDGLITIGYGPFTLTVAAGHVQIFDASHTPLGPPVPIPFDFTEISASPDGRYFAFGRLGGHADLYSGAGEFIETVSIGDGDQYEGAQTGPSFSADGEYMAVVTTRGGFGVWTTNPLQRIEVPNPGDWVSGRLMGEWLFVIRTDGTVLQVDPISFDPVGEPLLMSGLGYSKLDETNLRVTSSSGLAIKVWDLETGHQLGGDLPYAGGSARVEFTADGRVLSVPASGAVHLWNFDTDTWADIACELAGRNLTVDEWEQLGPRTIERRATCPQYPLQ